VNPVVVIPSYWTGHDEPSTLGEVGVYDYATPITKPVPELQTCLESLEGVRGVLRVIVLVISEASCAEGARARVNAVCRMHPDLNPLVVGAREADLMARAIGRVSPTMMGDVVSLRGYGAIRNMGLAVAAALGHDVVVFMDDDEVVADENFLINAAYGLGLATRQGLPIAVKSGCYHNSEGSPYATEEKPHWYDRRWSKRVEFNQMMHRLQGGTRISRSSYACGGCLAVGARAFCSVPFDPFITRGEDLDYVLDLRIYGYDVWFDQDWWVWRKVPPLREGVELFRQDAYRWEYEARKLQVANGSIGLHPVRPESLRPYPAEWVSPEVSRRISTTALLRAVGCREHRRYLQIWRHGHAEAREWAAREGESYFRLQTYWSKMMGAIWANPVLAQELQRLGGVVQTGEERHG
jgi:hypothetical protein